MVLKEVFGKLIAPMKYLTVFHAEKVWFDYVLPLFFATIFTLGYLSMPTPFPLMGAAGLIGQINGLLQVLIGFYIASLAAVATFHGEGMDSFMDGTPPTVYEKRQGVSKKVQLTRRRFLSYLFGYLALMSLVLFFVGVIVNLSAVSMSHWINSADWLIYCKYISLFIYLFFICNVFITTLLGLYYLTIRIHHHKGELSPPSK